jgi:hypothetical protein
MHKCTNPNLESFGLLLTFGTGNGNFTSVLKKFSKNKSRITEKSMIMINK